MSREQLQSYLHCPLCSNKLWQIGDCFQCANEQCPVSLIKIKPEIGQEKKFKETVIL